MNDEPESILVKLTRMEGKLDLSNMRHDQHDERFRGIDSRLHSHGNRIGVLEAARHLGDGERKGLTHAGKVLWAATGLIPGGAIVALIMRAFQ